MPLPENCDLKSLTPDQFSQLLQLAGPWASSIFAALAKLVDMLNKKQMVQAQAKVACQAGANCCERALDAQLAALAAIMECHCCCTPDEPEPASK